MISGTLGKPTKFKRVIYLISFITLGLLLSLNLHALIEINYLSWISGQGRIANFYGGCALPPLIQVCIWLLGISGGYFVGTFCWKKVYIERSWGRHHKI
ncbi:MAG: hypothetical protein PWQ35_437 [Patescibacteria group bacterium]|nr:hypothetical protein [Patescibacteria group bacterium]